MSKFVKPSRNSIKAVGIEAAWDERRLWRDLWKGLMTKGERLGVGSASVHTFRLGLIAVTALVFAVNAMNIITLLHDPRNESFAEPIVRESTSAISFILFVWIPWLARDLAPIELPFRWRTGLIHSGTAVLFSIGHVGIFVGFRAFTYRLAAWPYGFHLTEFPYELRKDVIAYLLVVAIFSAAASFVKGDAPEVSANRPTFDIRDGARLARVPVNDILAIASAGNYAEFSLCDGRRLLMRKTLSALERELAPLGFVRTHRSWIVNERAVTGVKPDGSGDFTIELSSASAPLSRRFPQALARLRGQ